jgi:hypothetical protein
LAAHSRLRVLAGAGLALGGGAMMAAGGLANHSFLVSLLDVAGGEASSYLGGASGLLIMLAVTVVSLLIGLGGLTVMAGGLVIYTRHITAGRLLVALGGGGGFVGLLLSFGYTAFTAGYSVAVSHSVYWLGLILAVFARRVTKRA